MKGHRERDDDGKERDQLFAPRNTARDSYHENYRERDRDKGRHGQVPRLPRSKIDVQPVS